MGLFNKDKKQKISQKAHSLLDECKAIDAAGDKLIKDWNRELDQAKTARERAKINSKYEKLDAENEREESRNYNEYYKLMHKTFGNIDLKDYEDLPDKFMDHKLVDRLFRRN